MRTERYTQTAAQTYAPGGVVLQDFAYEYDVAGNILKIHDRTPASGVLNTQLGVDALDRVFEYDPLYRLLSATGRETGVSRQATQNKLWDDPPHSTVLSLAPPSTETVQYDAAGNILRLDHAQLSAAGNTIMSSRRFALAQDAAGAPVNNRLGTVTVGTDTYQYRYDDNGNLIQENSERHFEWDHSDRMRVFRNQTTGTRPTTHAQYLYDATGQRVKKYVINQQKEVEITINIDGLFEHHVRGREQAGTIRITGQNNSLHVMDNQSRIAMVRVGAAFPDDGAPNVTVKYHLGDHLGSGNIVVGGATATGDTFINREEYTPYGETSFGSFARKRYRFTGKERDEESGLYYHGARYYAPWLARWASCDPKILRRSGSQVLNRYTYVLNNPLKYADPEGQQEAPVVVDEIPRDNINNPLPPDNSPVPQLKGPEFPPWFTEEQKRMYIARYSKEGTDLIPHGIDPTTRERIPHRGYYTKHEERIFFIGECAKLAITLLLSSAISRLPAWIARGASTAEAAPGATAGESVFGGTPSPKLAQTIEQLQAEQVSLRGNFVNVPEGHARFNSVTSHGGAFHDIPSGTTYVNMETLEANALRLTPKQVLQHEMGHFRQSIDLARNAEGSTLSAHFRFEAEASLSAAKAAKSPADVDALLQHATDNFNAARMFKQP